MKALDSLFIKAQNKLAKWGESLKEERGASDMVAILVVIVIVVAVAAIFREKLIEVVNKTFEKLLTFVS